MVEEMEHASLTLLTHGKAYQAELVRLRQYVAAAQDAIAHHLAEQKESLVVRVRRAVGKSLNGWNGTALVRAGALRPAPL